jgi:hypothetical protein
MLEIIAAEPERAIRCSHRALTAFGFAPAGEATA